MQLTEEGLLVTEAWRSSRIIRHEVTMGPFVVMPDHFHALVGIDACHIQPTEPRGIVTRPRLGRTIGSLIAGFKAASTGAINRLRSTPGDRFWRVGYYDRIVRDHDAWDRIARYINTNPRRWIERYGSGAACR